MERTRLELVVGLFLLIGLICLAYLSLKLGKIRLWGSTEYKVYAVFPNVGGLKSNADVTMAGVRIGHVDEVELQSGQARVGMNIRKEVHLEDDSIASIKTKGIIGDKYVSITPGASDSYVGPGGTIRETQPPLDIENLVGKFVFGSVDKALKENKPDQKDLSGQEGKSGTNSTSGALGPADETSGKAPSGSLEQKPGNELPPPVEKPESFIPPKTLQP